MALTNEEYARAQACWVSVQGLLIALSSEPATAHITQAAKVAALKIAARSDMYSAGNPDFEKVSDLVYRELENIFRVVRPAAE